MILVMQISIFISNIIRLNPLDYFPIWEMNNIHRLFQNRNVNLKQSYYLVTNIFCYTCLQIQYSFAQFLFVSPRKKTM